MAFLVKVPASWRVVGNGRLGAFATDDARGATFMWEERNPIPTYTMVFGATQFTVSTHRPVVSGRDTIPIQVWAYPEDSVWADTVLFRRATEIAETLQRIIGPFPYEKLAHVQAVTKYGGMENASAIFYNEKAIVERRMGEGTVRHETAHQWFGDAVTPRDWPHLWLSEGFASYFDLVAGAAMDGDSVLRAGMQRNAQSYFASEVVNRPVVDTAQHDPNKLLNANAYQKGAWTLHMLRGLVGDTAFFDGIRRYYRTYRDSTAVTADFQQVMERVSGRELDWFFHQWLWQPGYPQLSAEWRVMGPGLVTVGITQVQPRVWGQFRIPKITLEFRNAAGKTERRTVALGGTRGDVLPITGLPFVPTDLRVDPDGELLLTATVRQLP